jgi:ubiquinone/menaquinone biosynthesis C-methylase UbiE
VKLLHVGCGGQKAPLSGYDEIGLDLDPKSGADLIGSMLDIPLEDGSVDGVYTSHTLEHVTLHDGLRALREFRRVIKEGGRVWIIVPNIGVLADYIRDGRLYEKLYDSPGGPVCAVDMLYGHQGWIERDNKDRAYRFQHQFGYTPETLAKSLEAAGFHSITSKTINVYDLVATGLK